MSKLQKWTLLSKTDVSVSKWFPIENRVYRLPNGKIIDDFTVTTVPDVSQILPITKDKKIILVKQFKPGVGDLFIQFPAGRTEPHHHDMLETAHEELAQETGYTAQEFKEVGKYNAFSTKGTEVIYAYLATDAVKTDAQKLDVTEEIELLLKTPSEVEEMILTGEIWCPLTIAHWYVARRKFPEAFE